MFVFFQEMNGILQLKTKCTLAVMLHNSLSVSRPQVIADEYVVFHVVETCISGQNVSLRHLIIFIIEIIVDIHRHIANWLKENF